MALPAPWVRRSWPSATAGRASSTPPVPRKICIGMGAIARTGSILACVPNHLLVRIAGKEGKKPKDYDLLSR